MGLSGFKVLRERKAKVEGSYRKWGGGRPPLVLCRGIKTGMKSVLMSAANREIPALSALSSPSLIQLHLLYGDACTSSKWH